MKPLHLAAIFATLLVVSTGVNALLRPPPRPGGPPMRAEAPSRFAEGRCIIKRAVFGGTVSALLKAKKDRVVHYIVLDLPADNPRMPDYQSNWLEANYGAATPSLVGVYPSVEAAIAQAASLCKSN
jgi:hypothetical protein